MRNSEAFSQLVLDSLDEHIAVLDQQGTIVFVNKAWREFGCHNSAPVSADSYLGANYLAVCEQSGDAEAQSVGAGIRAVIAGTQSEFHVDYPCHSPNQQRWFQLVVAALPGCHRGALICHRPITESKQTEAALQHFKAIINASADAIISMTSEGIIQSWNPGAERLFGYLPEEMIGQNIQKLIPPDRWAEEPRILARLAEGQNLETIETIRRHKNGQLIEVSATISAISDGQRKVIDASKIDGDITGCKNNSIDHAGEGTSHVCDDHRPVLLVSCIMRNITARKKAEAANAALEAQLRESQKMQALGTLAGGIAHDFNNTLATILGNAELAREDSLNNPPALESLEAILKAGARARNLVKQILAFSRRQPLERKRIDLAPVVQETAHLLRATLPARLGLDCYCVPGVPMVLADASQIEQVMINLVTNAMQAIPDGPGRIEIKLDTVVLDAGLVDTYPALHALSVAHPGNAVRLTVSDTGVGMALDTQKRLFEPFFTTKPIGAGTGLGLSVVHGIVQGHAGAIVVESEPGKGAIFTIYLPASAPLAMDHEPDGTRAPPTTSSEMRLCLMHIDDDPGILSFFQRYFERHACRISAYGDPRTALEVLSADPSAFDLVLTDYNMPDLSGLDVARRVRDIDVSLPVVVLSGFVDETLRAQAEACGIREILSKSDPVELIYRVVQRIAQSNTSRSAASGK